MKHDRIVLVGPMGAGKSTIGRQLAEKLDYEFVDSDHEIEARTGADISWIFDVEGEPGFRQRESAVIADLMQRKRVVLATGGGAVLRKENRQQFLNAHVIYLQAPIEHLVSRTSRDKGRPLLQGQDHSLVLTRLMEERGPLYDEVGDRCIDTHDKSVKEVVDCIVEGFCDTAY